MAEGLTQQDIQQGLDELTAIARKRMQECDPGIAGVMGGSEIDFMTSDEREHRHQLVLLLPSSEVLRHEAKMRIAQRIRERKIARSKRTSSAESAQVFWDLSSQHVKDDAAKRNALTASHHSAEPQHQSSLF